MQLWKPHPMLLCKGENSICSMTRWCQLSMRNISLTRLSTQKSLHVEKSIPMSDWIPSGAFDKTTTNETKVSRANNSTGLTQQKWDKKLFPADWSKMYRVNEGQWTVSELNASAATQRCVSYCQLRFVEHCLSGQGAKTTVCAVLWR